MSQRWSYAFLAVLIGCGNTPVVAVPFDVVIPTDTNVPTDTGGGADVVDAGSRPDVVDAGSRPDVVDAGGGTDVIDAGGGTDVIDAGGGADVVDAGGGTDVVDAGGGTDARVDMCPMPRSTISLPGTVMPIMGTTSGTSQVASASCQTNSSGPEHVYALTVTQRAAVTLSTDNAMTNFDTVLSVRRNCSDPASEVACNDDAVGLNSVVRAVLEPGSYSVIVDGYNSRMGNYVLSATSSAAAANAVCASAATLGATALTNQNVAEGGATASTCLTNGGGQLFYTATIPANTRALFRATPTGMMPTWTPQVRVLDNCMATTCVASASGTAGGAASVSVTNTNAMPRTVTLAVSASSLTATGTFDLAQTNTALAANASCMAPVTLTTAGVTGVDLATGGAAATACVTGGSGTLFYSVTVPANTIGTVRATPTGMMPAWTPVIRALDNCMATTCVANSTGTSGMPATLQLANPGMTARTFILSVNATSSTATGTFDLAFSTQMIVPGASCEMAIDVTPGMGRNGEDSAMGGPASTLCQTGAGTQRWYRVAIPAGQRLTTTATPGAMSGRRAIVRYIDNCAATACISSTAGTTNMASTLGINNPGMAARTVYVSVSSDSASMPVTFDLATAVAPVVLTSACDVPATLATDGMAVAGDTARGIARPTRCSTTDMGTEVFYTVTVPALQRVTVRATPAMGGTWRGRIRSATDCAATACFSSNVATTDGGEAVLALDNPTHLPRTMVVSVSPTTTATGGAFNISATAGAIPMAPTPHFTFATIPAACDDVSMGTAVAPMAGWIDDSTSAIAAMPFTFRFFGTDVTHFSVASNGFAQLWTSAMGTPLASFSNSTLPNTSTPNNLVAAFWDDLGPVDAMTTGVRTATLGTMPNRRFVIAWNNWRTLSGTSAERLTFQAKLFETTGVIEYHYCTINPTSPRGTGSQATIGVEDAMGMRGNQIANDYPNVVATGTAFRLTPP